APAWPSPATRARSHARGCARAVRRQAAARPAVSLACSSRAPALDLAFGELRAQLLVFAPQLGDGKLLRLVLALELPKLRRNPEIADGAAPLTKIALHLDKQVVGNLGAVIHRGHSLQLITVTASSAFRVSCRFKTTNAFSLFVSMGARQPAAGAFSHLSIPSSLASVIAALQIATHEICK